MLPRSGRLAVSLIAGDAAARRVDSRQAAVVRSRPTPSLSKSSARKRRHVAGNLQRNDGTAHATGTHVEQGAVEAIEVTATANHCFEGRASLAGAVAHAAVRVPQSEM